MCLEEFIQMAKSSEEMLVSLPDDNPFWNMYYMQGVTIVDPCREEYNSLDKSESIADMMIFLVGFSLMISSCPLPIFTQLRNTNKYGQMQGYITATGNKDLSTSYEVPKALSENMDYLETLMLLNPYGEIALVYMRMLRGYASSFTGYAR